MKTFSCKKCGSAEVYIKENGAQTGLYCSDCGAWQKWLGVEEKRLAEKWIQENTYQVNINKIDELKEAALPLLKFLNKYYHPHCYAVVTEGSVEILEGNMVSPLPIRD